MRLIRGQHNIRALHQGTVITMGNFDGVHLGHQALLNEVMEKAKSLKQQSTLITFEPQPNEYFSMPKIAPRLMRLREKLAAIEKIGIDQVLCLRFDHALSLMSAHDFVNTILVDGLDMKAIIIGDDFRFGHHRLGDFALLNMLGQHNGFEVEAMSTVTSHQMRISSTLIRETLEKGDMNMARQLLGRPFGMSGHVAHGDKRGRVLGFPTANIHLHRRAVPIQGVFAVRVQGLGESPVDGVANVGNRPMLEDNTTLLEVHMFDFDREIYGQHVHVEFIKKLRDEENYPDFEALKVQMFKDADDAKAALLVIKDSDF